MPANAREARAESTALFVDAWGTLTNEPTIKYDNDDRSDVEALTEWVGFSWQENVGDIAALGSTMFRQSGVIIVEIYTAAGRGTRRMDELKDLALQAFHTAPPGNVRYRRPTPLYVGPSGKWFQQNVTVEFEYDQLR